MLEIRLLGQFSVQRDGAVVEIPSRPAQALLAYLAMNAGKAQRREKVAGLLWPDSTEENARTYLRQALWKVRTAIGSDPVQSDRLTVSFATSEDTWLDTIVLESAPPEGWNPETLAAAVSVYQGELLPGFYDDWVTLERERLRALYERRMEALLELLLEAQRWDETEELGERWIAMGGVPEPAYRALMRAHAAQGNLAAVSTVYQRGVQSLEDELGVPPSTETTDLYESLIAGGQSPSPASVAGRVETPGVEAPPAFLMTVEGEKPAREELFVGRERELAVLEEQLEKALTGHGRVLFVTGEAGQGKTTLLRQFARRAQESHPDLIVASGACPVYTPVCAPYGLFREALELLTGEVESAWTSGTIGREQAARLWRFMPEVVDALLEKGRDLVGALVPAEALKRRARRAEIDKGHLDRLEELVRSSREGFRGLSEQGELFAEYADVLMTLAQKRPLLLILDDLHWSDPSSIGLLSHLGHRLPESALLLVGAYRPEEVNQGRDGQAHPLIPVLNEYKRRFGDVSLTLDEAQPGGGRSFVDALLDSEPNALGDSFREDLTRHTGGHPLFTVELLREMRERGTLRRDDSGRWIVGTESAWGELPPRVEGVIETRINRLDPELQEWLSIASVEGEIFTAEVIARAQNVSERMVVKRLSGELDKQHRLVAAQGVLRVGGDRLSRYKFRHNLFQSYLYKHLDGIERGYLHEQVGQALEELYTHELDEVADRLAYHFQMAGLAEKAVNYLTVAGDKAASVYAYEEAIDFYQQALDQAQADRGRGLTEEAAIALFTKLGRTLEHNANFNQALAVYKEMERLGQEWTHEQMRLNGLVAQGTLYAIPSPVQEVKKGQDISHLTLELARELGDRQAEAKSLWNLLNAYEYDAQLDKAIEYGELSLGLARELDLGKQIAFTINDLAGCYWVSGEFARAKEYFSEASGIWRAAGNKPMLADSLFASSLADMFAGDYDEAIAKTDQAWEIGIATGNRWTQTLSRSRIGFVHRERGEPAKGIRQLEQSVRLGQQLSLPGPQGVTRGELAFSLAQLGAGERGLEVARLGLAVVSEHTPPHRPFLLAALTQCQLVNGDLDAAEETVRQARTDTQWMVWPLYCMALILAEGQLRLAQSEPHAALEILERFAADLRRMGMRSYLPAALDAAGQAFLSLGEVEEARTHFLEAREVADALGARGRLWHILWHLSQVEDDPQRAADLRKEAQALVNDIAGQAGSPELRASFLALPEVRTLFEDGEGSG